MKASLLSGALAVLASAAACSSQPASAPAQIDTRAIVRALLGPPPDVAPVLGELRRLRASSSGNERVLIDRSITLLEAMEREPDAASVRFPELVQLVRDFIDLPGADAVTQRQLVATFATLPVTASNLGVDASELRVEAITRARALVARFPRDGRAYGVLATAFTTAYAPERSIIEAYTKCAELDPTAQHCVEAVEGFRTAAKAPRCSTLKATFALRAGADALTAADVVSVVMADRTIDMVLTPAAAKKLETLTARLAASAGSMSIMLGDEVVFSAAVSAPIDNGRLAVSPGQEEPRALLERLCEKVVQP